MAKKDDKKVDTPKETTETPKNEPQFISSKNFVKKLKQELKGEKISAPVFVAFEKIVKSIDSEDNYRKIWKTTFKRS